MWGFFFCCCCLFVLQRTAYGLVPGGGGVFFVCFFFRNSSGLFIFYVMVEGFVFISRLGFVLIYSDLSQIDTSLKIFSSLSVLQNHKWVRQKGAFTRADPDSWNYFQVDPEGQLRKIVRMVFSINVIAFRTLPEMYDDVYFDVPIVPSWFLSYTVFAISCVCERLRCMRFSQPLISYVPPPGASLACSGRPHPRPRSPLSCIRLCQPLVLTYAHILTFFLRFVFRLEMYFYFGTVDFLPLSPWQICFLVWTQILALTFSSCYTLRCWLPLKRTRWIKDAVSKWI